MRCLLTDPVVGEPLLDPVVDLTQLQLLGGTVADGHGCKGGHDMILLRDKDIRDNMAAKKEDSVKQHIAYC